VAYDDELAERIRKVLGVRSDVTEKKMFGGLTFLCGGRMCCGVTGTDLVVRVMADEVTRVMKQRHVRPMDFTGRPLRGFVYVAPGGYRTAADLESWLERGLRFVESDEAPRVTTVSVRSRRRANRPLRVRR